MDSRFLHNIAQVEFIFGAPITIAIVLSVLDIKFLLGNTLIQVMFASRDDTTISFGNFLYVISRKPHLVRSLTVRTRLFIWTSCSSAPTISIWTDLNVLRTASNLLSPSIVSMFILRAVNVYMIVFRPFTASVDSHPYIFIIEPYLILNDAVKRNTQPFKNIKSTPIC